jgi:molecular chaperone DnaK (HSP70)
LTLANCDAIIFIIGVKILVLRIFSVMFFSVCLCRVFPLTYPCSCPVTGVFSAASCLAELYHSRHAENVPADDDSTVLIVDVGGRHTVAAVLRVTRASWRVVHSASARVGAADIDDALSRHFLAKFESEKRQINPRALPRLRGSCERLKKMLSTIDKAAVECEGLFGDVDASLAMNRSEFDALVQPLSALVRAVVADALAAATESPPAEAMKLTAVELLGGTAASALNFTIYTHQN